MKKTILSLVTLISLSNAELLIEDFGLDKNKALSELNASVSVVADDDEMIGGAEEIIQKITLKKYDKVAYNPSMAGYATNNPGTKGKSKFKDYMENNNIDELIFKRFLDSEESLEALKMSAAYYDWYLEKPEYAENFYKRIFKMKSELALSDKYFLSDYLIRTNRGHLIHKVIQKDECSVIFKGRGNCYYYLGLDDYLNTGNRANRFLSMSRNKNKLAKKLYRLK